MEFKSFWSIYKVKKEWLQLIKKQSKDIYQTYDFNKLCYLYRITSISNIKKFNILCDFIVGYEDNKPVCIAPLVIDRKPTKCIRLLGHGTNAGYLDFIYKEAKYVPKMLEYINEKYKNYNIEFIFVKEESPLTKMLKSSESFNNYAIFIKDYETYFSSLSKSTRQNIRTAYNRLEKDGHKYKECIFNKDSKEIEKILGYCNEIYHKRKKDWVKTEIEYTPLVKRKVLKRDVINQSVRSLEEAIVVVLFIDEIPAGYFIGLKYENGIYIPRLAIDVKFARYSPGMILINEYLKKIKLNEKAYIFDLCRGEEKYKSFLKGEISITNRLVRGS